MENKLTKPGYLDSMDVWWEWERNTHPLPNMDKVCERYYQTSGISNSNKLEQIMEILSPRQKQIIQMRADGYSYKEIAKELEISVNTVKHHLKEVRRFGKTYPFHPKESSITNESKRIGFEDYLKQIDRELKMKAYVYWRDWEIKGMDWEDIAQELRIHLMNRFDTWKKKSSFRTWANRVMLNKIKDIVRNNNTSKDVLDRIDTLSTEELAEKDLDVNNYGEITKR